MVLESVSRFWNWSQNAFKKKQFLTFSAVFMASLNEQEINNLIITVIDNLITDK